MSLQTKVPCLCTHEFWLDDHPRFRKFPLSCPWCHGTKNYELQVDFENYQGSFQSVDWDSINDYHDDIYVAFKCQCGDEMHFSEGGTIACKCGRVYRLSVSLDVDNTHINEPEWLITEYHRLQKERLEKSG